MPLTQLTEEEQKKINDYFITFFSEKISDLDELKKQNEYLDAAKSYIKQGACVNVIDQYGRTPLHYTCLNSHLEVVKFLLEKGADINQKNRYGMSPLDVAKECNDVKIVNYLNKAKWCTPFRDYDAVGNAAANSYAGYYK